jgi:hypothetical protein
MVCNRNKQLKIGIGIEMEHAHNFPKNLRKTMAKRIATDHIKEFPCYYTKGLIPMENKLKRLKK